MAGPQRHQLAVRRPVKDHWMICIDPGKIRQGRMFRGWSQKKLGLLCDRSQNAIYLLESGKTEYIVEEFAMALCRWLELNPEEVFRGMPDTFVPGPTSSSGRAEKVVSE